MAAKSQYKILEHLKYITEAYQANTCDVTVSFISKEGDFCIHRLRNLKADRITDIRVSITDAVTKNEATDLTIVVTPVSSDQKHTS